MSGSSSPKIPEWTTRQVILATIFIVTVILAFWLVYQFLMVVVVLFISIVLGTAIEPGVVWLNKRGLPRSTGVILIYLGLLLTIAALIWVISPLIANQVTEISFDLPRYYDTFRGMLFSSSNRISQEISIHLPPTLNLLNSNSTSNGEALSQAAQTIQYAGLIIRTLLVIMTVFLLTFYWTLEKERSIRSLLLLAPIHHRERIRELVDAIETKLGGYIRGQSILSLTVGSMALIAYLLIGLPNSLILAIIAGILEAVPLFGPILGAIPATLVGLSIDPTRAVEVIGATMLIQGFENHFLVPRVMNQSVGVNPILTLLALAAFTSLLGLPGALLAIPVAAIIQLLLDRFVLARVSNKPFVPVGRDQISRLRYEARELSRDVRKQLRTKQNLSSNHSDQLEDAIESIANELDSILMVQSGSEETQE